MTGPHPLFAIDQCIVIAAADASDDHHADVSAFLAAAAEVGARIGVATTLQQDLNRAPAERRDEILAFVKDQSWKVLPGLFTLDYSPLPDDDDEMADLAADPSHPPYDTNAYHDYHHYETAVRNQATAFVTSDKKFIKRMRQFENLPVPIIQPPEAISLLRSDDMRYRVDQRCPPLTTPWNTHDQETHRPGSRHAPVAKRSHPRQGEPSRHSRGVPESKP